MSYTLDPMESHPPVPDRRRHARQQVRSLTYAELGEGNGGIVLDVSEDGFAVQAARVLIGDGSLRISFELPESGSRIEASGQIIWTSESKKRGGAQFVDLSEEARKQILEWISLEALPVNFQDEALHGEPLETEQPELGATISESPSPVPEPVAAHAAAEEQTEAPISPSDTATPAGTEEPVAVEVSLSTVLTPELPDDLELTPTGKIEPRLAVHPTLFRGKRNIAALTGFLAVISLLAGIAASRARWSGVAELLGTIKRVTAGKSAPAQAGASPSAASAASTFPIEVVDLNDQHWLLASNSGATVPVESPRRQAPVGVPAPAPRTKITAQPWSLSHPNLPQNRVVVSSAVERAPPLPLLQPPDNAESTLRSLMPAESAGLLPTPPKASGQGHSLQMAKLIHRVEPVYPWAANHLHVEGTVKLRATIGRDGTVRTLEPVEGMPMFTQAAMAAVRQWRYEPAILDGQLIEAEANIIIVFRLPR